MQWLGIDIGGANLKAADGLGYADSRSFALWKEPLRLTQELRTLIAESPPCDHLAVTMTGELADCFQSRTQGVHFILQAVEQAAGGRHTRVYLHNGTLVTPTVAHRRPLEAAAANWHALARYAGRFAGDEPALLIDIGSTTCDIVPLVRGEPATPHRSDTDRLLHGELVYAGVERTPVCALVSEVPYRERSCPVAREVFATTRDACILLDLLREDPTDLNTADGGPATKAAARTRMSRMICAEAEQFHHRDAVIMAREVLDALIARVADGLRQVLVVSTAPPHHGILSGHGEFVARAALESLRLSWKLTSLTDQLGRQVARCAAAHAIAVLAREAVTP